MAAFHLTAVFGLSPCPLSRELNRRASHWIELQQLVAKDRVFARGMFFRWEDWIVLTSDNLLLRACVAESYNREACINSYTRTRNTASGDANPYKQSSPKNDL